MPNLIEIENIEEMRLQEGIDDIELRAEIRALKIGDHVKLTLVTGTAAFESILVRITSISGLSFRGKLARKPTSSSLVELDVGSALSFSASHIHSIPKGRPASGKELCED
jgi:hypothetical protein